MQLQYTSYNKIVYYWHKLFLCMCETTLLLFQFSAHVNWSLKFNQLNGGCRTYLLNVNFEAQCKENITRTKVLTEPVRAATFSLLFKRTIKFCNQLGQNFLVLIFIKSCFLLLVSAWLHHFIYPSLQKK